MNTYRYYVKSPTSNGMIEIGFLNQEFGSIDIDDSFKSFILNHEDALEIATWISIAVKSLNLTIIGIDDLDNETLLLEFDPWFNCYFGREATMSILGIKFISIA